MSCRQDLSVANAIDLANASLPLSEELLKGEFAGLGLIVVDAIKNEEGKVKRLDFQGKPAEGPPEPATAVAGGEGEEDEG